ncbi:MAG: endopeptidase La [Nitrospinae bacterium]|nr:endopeptidase La [Nitrospinota bacterium]
MEKKEPLQLPLLPLRDIVLFPHMIIPLFVGRDRSIEAVEAASQGNKEIALVAQKDSDIDIPTVEDLYDVGVLGSILQKQRLPDGTLKILVEGIKRVEITKISSSDHYLKADIIPLETPIKNTPEMKASMEFTVRNLKKYIKLKDDSNDNLNDILEIDNPDYLSDAIAIQLNIKTSEQQEILETVDPLQRLETINSILKSEINILKLEMRVQDRVKLQVEKNQKEYYLQEQMKAIQSELGRNEESASDLEELEERIKKAKMPKEVLTRATKELSRLRHMPVMSSEGAVVRNYVEWLADMPWSIHTKENHDIERANKILDEDHYGIEKVKERILEHLSTLICVKSMKSPIICLVGPPGVGKTSLGKSIARATGRKFARISLGGLKDEAEIRGHRRTYISALPGKIIQSIKKVNTKNPVFMLDEIDKLGADFRGDPASALLEVLDPEQNNAFNDHFLEVDFDLSEVMFIATANVIHTIPKPLLDRMEIIRMEGYTENEKIKIAQKYLVPKNIEKHGLDKVKINFGEALLRLLVEKYTRESGVRNLEREIASICRKVTRLVVEAKNKKKQPSFTSKALEKLLPIPKFNHSNASKKNEVGLVNGLAWTEVGGEMLLIEVLVMEGKGKLTLTGKLGEVMQESARAALGYVRSKAATLGIPTDFHNKNDIHIHIPEGAIPKDGPSAGITLATGIVSALTNISVKADVAMTGEITLLGRVLPIGGLKEKMLAAQRAGIDTIIIPERNRVDLGEIPSNIKDSFKIHCVETVDEVLKIALTKQLKSCLVIKKGGKKDASLSPSEPAH